MEQRFLGREGPAISPIGIGAMSFSDFYGPTSEADSHAILTAARSDFREVVQQRNLAAVWDHIDQNFRDSLRIRPPFVMNGSASSIIKSHLEAIGFNLLRVRSNLVELRDVLDS